jgi:hypothetical protein
MRGSGLITLNTERNMIHILLIAGLAVSVSAFASERKPGCRDVSAGGFAYEDENFPVTEQLKVPGGAECRCLPSVTHPDVDHGHNNTYAQVLNKNGKLSCAFQTTSYLGTEAEQVAIRTCLVKFTGVSDFGSIPMRRIHAFSECVEAEISLNE